MSVVAAIVTLALLAPLWAWLAPSSDRLDGWTFAAYAVILLTLAAYRGWLSGRERKALGQALSRRRAEGGESPIPWPARSPLVEQMAMSLLAVGLMLALVYAPEERTMGQVQRIFYVHVPCAWVAGLAFAVVFSASLVVLARRSVAADRVARSSAEVGVVFTSLVLVSGPIWARPVWGIWWTWDARLTTTLLLWLTYIGYLMLRAFVTDPDRERRLGAAIGVLGFFGVLIDYMAIRWWRTQHPQPVFAGGEGSGLDPAMRKAFWVMLLAMTLVYLALLKARLAIARIEQHNQETAAR